MPFVCGDLAFVFEWLISKYKGLLTADDLLDSMSQGLPILPCKLQLAEVKENSLPENLGGTYGVHEVVAGKGLIEAGIFLNNLPDKHARSIAWLEPYINI